MQTERTDALRAIASMTERSARAREKFKQGTAQYTLLTNRIHALTVASALLEQESGAGDRVIELTRSALEKALAPIASLISKSEKAQKRLAPGSWQHTMLEQNLAALYLALPVLEKTWKRMGTDNESACLPLP